MSYMRLSPDGPERGIVAFAAFTSRLRDDVDIDSVRADLLDVVGTTIRPAHASVWLRAGRR